MNVAAAVVRKRVGRRMMSAKPTQTTMKRRAPTRAMIRAARRAKMMTEMVMTMKRPRGKPVRATWEAMKDCACVGCQCGDFGRGVKGRGRGTASMGFSVANLEILASSSLRFSGGKMLSSQAEPLFSMPPTVPWRAPVAPLSNSAMSVVCVVDGARCLWCGPVEREASAVNGRYGGDVYVSEFEVSMWKVDVC